MLYAKINVKSNHFLFLTSLESPLNKGGSERVWKYSGYKGKVLIASPPISGRNARKLAAITIVAGGYGGDMPEDQAYDLLDDIDFYYNKVKCRKIEKLLPVLSKLVIEEQKLL